MPELRYYIVTETREVKVSANNPKDAAIFGSMAFRQQVPADDIQLHVLSPVRERTLEVREDV